MCVYIHIFYLIFFKKKGTLCPPPIFPLRPGVSLIGIVSVDSLVPSNTKAGGVDCLEPAASALVCYWVGSLDFNCLGNQVGFSTKPTKS